MKYLSNAVKKRPKNAEYNYKLAMAYFYQYVENSENENAYQNALKYFDIAIENTNENAVYYFWRGRLKLMGKSSDAKTDFEQAIQKKKYRAIYQQYLGRAYLAAGDLMEAAECVAMAEKLDSGNAETQSLAAYIADCLANTGGGWGDSGNGRPSYATSEIYSGILGNDVTFNSISDAGIGDEKNFVAAKATDTDTQIWNANRIEVEDGKIYTIRLYVHNNNPLGYNAVAENVIALFSLPCTVGKSQTIIGYLDCSNARPTRYWDGVTLVSDENFYIEYLTGSARYSNAQATMGLPDEVITAGARLGYDRLDGRIPGGDDYSGIVTIDVKVHKSVSAKLSMVTRLKGTDVWSEAVDAHIGDEVEYQIEFVNLSAETVNNVMIRDVLPNNVEYVSGSTLLFNASYQNGLRLDRDTVTTTGINIGNYAPLGNAYVRFTGRIVDETLASGNNQLVNWAAATVRSADDETCVYKDDASVLVNRST